MSNFEVLFNGKNVWYEGDEPQTFSTLGEAVKALDQYCAELDADGIDYEPADYQIEKIRQ